MEALAQEIPPVKKKPRQETRLTVMFMKSFGTVRSFKISRGLIFGASGFFLVYFIVSIFIINDYLIFDHRFPYVRRVYDIQAEKIKALKSALLIGEKALHRSNQHKALLEDYIHNLEEQREPEHESSQGGYVEERNTIQNIEQPELDRENEKTPNDVVDIRDIVIQKEGSRMIVRFNLANNKPGQNAVAGYIHIIGMGKNNDSPAEWTYPKEKIENGVPLNFRRGQPFLIQRFKPYRQRFNVDSNSQLPTAVRILVYDQSGILILEKRFEVTNAS